MFKFFGFIITLIIIYLGVGIPYVYANFILGTIKNIAFYVPIFIVGWIAWKAFNLPFLGRKKRRKSW